MANGKTDTMTPATGIRLNTKIIMANVGNCGICMMAKITVVIRVLHSAIKNWASKTTPKVLMNFSAKNLMS